MEKHHKKVKKKTSRKKIKLTQASEPDSTSSRKKKRGTSPPANDGGEGRRRRRRRTKRWRAINEKRTKEESLMKRAIRDWPCITKSDKSSASFRCDDGVFHTLGTTWATWSDPTWPIRICWWPFGNREKVKRGRSQPMRRARGRSRRWKAPMGEGRPTIIYSFDSEWSVLCAFFSFSFLFSSFFSLSLPRVPPSLCGFSSTSSSSSFFSGTQPTNPPSPFLPSFRRRKLCLFKKKKKRRRKRRRRRRARGWPSGYDQGGVSLEAEKREREREKWDFFDSVCPRCRGMYFVSLISAVPPSDTTGTLRPFYFIFFLSDIKRFFSLAVQRSIRLFVCFFRWEFQKLGNGPFIFQRFNGKPGKTR